MDIDDNWGKTNDIGGQISSDIIVVFGKHNIRFKKSLFFKIKVFNYLLYTNAV